MVRNRLHQAAAGAVFALALMFSFMVRTACAWGEGHDTIGQCVLEKLPPRWAQKWDAKWRKPFMSSTHAPDKGDLCKELESERMWFLENGWKLGYAMHGDDMQMMFILRMAEAMKRQDDRSVFLLLAVISHNFADGASLNHDPLVHLQTYIWGKEGLDVCPRMESDIVFCRKNPHAQSVMAEALEAVEIPRALEAHSWMDILAKLVEIRESSAVQAMGLANWDVFESAMAWSSRPTPQNAQRLARAFMPTGMWGVKWTLWALRTAEEIAKGAVSFPAPEEAKRAHKELCSRSHVPEKRTLASDQAARRFLPAKDSPCTIGLFYDPLAFHTDGVTGAAGNTYAMLLTSTLREKFPKENIGLLDIRRYDRQPLDAERLKGVVLIAKSIRAYRGFDVARFRENLQKYVRAGGKVLVFEWDGVQALVSPGGAFLSATPIKDRYAAPAFAVGLEDFMKSKIHWRGEKAATYTCRREPRGTAGWSWLGARYWVDAQRAKERLRHLLVLEAPNGMTCTQGFAWPEDAPCVAYLPGYLAMGYILTDEKVQTDPFAFRLDAVSSAIIVQTLKLLIGSD